MPKNQPNKLPESPSILIILMGSLGDLIRGLCLVSHIKNNLHESRITWLVEPKWSDLVNFHPQIDKTIIFNRPRNILGVLELFFELKKSHFDITIDLQRHFKSGIFSFLSGAKKRIGFHRRDSKELNWLFNNEHIDYFGEQQPKILHYLEFTKHLNLDEPDDLDFGFSSLDHKSIAPAVISKMEIPFIAVVLGSSWQSKDWFIQSYMELITSILSSWEMGIVLIGDRSQIHAAAELCKKIVHKRLVNLVGGTSLMELMAVLKTAKAALGPDSGPGHMSAAVGTPFVTLFGPTSPTRTAPYKCEQLVVQSDLNCVGCYKKRCPDLDRKCMNLISAESVRIKLAEALSE